MAEHLGYRGTQVLTFIASTVERRGHAPSYSEIADAVGMNRTDVWHVIRRLENRGIIKRRSVGQRRGRNWHKPVIVLLEA